ncbi:MAG TPA: glycosyl transferase family 1, partial [Myxococcales bacterium]|nr:glycosyl transferase family 1 [Myxococcales bacterium]
MVHAHDFYTALLAVPAARLAGTRAIVGRLDLAHWLNVPQRVALAAATRSAHHVVANAEAIKRAIVETERLPAERVSVVHNGIDLARFDSDLGGPLAGPLPPLEGRTVIVHVANMTHPVKAQEVLFEALRALRARRPEVLLLLAGDGPRRAGLEELAAAMGLAGAVCFLGRRSDVPAILARGDIGVLCSSAEGLSNAIIEGMAASLPMVVTDAGGNGELVRDEENGFVVPIGSSTMLASRLEMLARARPLRTKMGQAGRAFVEHELRLERLLERHEALYRKVLSKG